MSELVRDCQNCEYCEFHRAYESCKLRKNKIIYNYKKEAENCSFYTQKEVGAQNE